MKSYTDIEQSKKLANILPLESADMYRIFENNAETRAYYGKMPTAYFDCEPCWSLAALINILKYPSLTQDVENKWFITDWTGARPKSEHGFDSPVDACYEMILNLHKSNLL